MQDLRSKTIRAGIANLGSCTVSVLLRIVSVMTLGRLLPPSDYGLMAMVTSFTGALHVLSGFGLSQAAIQRDTMTEERASTLFWVNVLLSCMLTLAALALAPIVSAFYHEPDLVLAMSVVAITFLLTGAGTQHTALLHREMRFGASALIDTIAGVTSTSIAIALAFAGWGYWALVSMLVSVPLITTLGAWLVTGWVPGAPRSGTGIGSLMHFGGSVTLMSLIAYLAGNFEKFLLGRFWGAQAIGIYSRAQNLVVFPADSLSSAVGKVALAAFSRARNDSDRLRRYFLKGFSLFVAVAMPLAMICALFAEDLIAVVLGPMWTDAAEIVRLLSPTLLVWAVGSPVGWLLNSLGLVERGVKIALVSAVLVIVGVTIGLHHGPRGVAIGYSAVMVLKIIPIIAWAIHGTPIQISEILGAFRAPLAASFGAAIIGCGAHALLGPTLPLVLRLFMDVALFGVAYIGLLLISTEQRSLCFDILRWWKLAPA